MKTFIIWFLCAIMLMIGIVGFVLVTNKETSNIVYYIANILKCRPPNNRNPLPAEMIECTPYLYKQIDLVKPKAILLLGLIAAGSLLNSKESLTKLRGNVFDINGIKTMVTYHPAALLRNPNWKRGCWEDIQKFRKLYDSLK